MKRHFTKDDVWTGNRHTKTFNITSLQGSAEKLGH